VGEILDHAINLKRARPGDMVRVPYEVTVGAGLRENWQAAFYSHDRINTSTPFARGLGLQDQVSVYCISNSVLYYKLAFKRSPKIL
jgi:hypothetical protein